MHNHPSKVTNPALHVNKVIISIYYYYYANKNTDSCWQIGYRNTKLYISILRLLENGDFFNLSPEYLFYTNMFHSVDIICNLIGKLKNSVFSFLVRSKLSQITTIYPMINIYSTLKKKYFCTTIYNLIHLFK